MIHAPSGVGMPSHGYRPPSGAGRLRHFAVHLGEMILAMMIGMAFGALVLVLIFSTVLSSTIKGLTTEEVTSSYATLICLVVAASMIALMVAWMRHRRMEWRPVTEMAVAMGAPLVPILILLWLDVIPGSSACGAYCAVMIPAMIVAMLVRLNVYTAPHAGHLAHVG